MSDQGRTEQASALWEDLRPRLEAIGSFEHLVAVWLFGSQANGEAIEGSDIDIACYYDLPTEQLGTVSVRLAGRLPERYDAEVFQLLPLPVRKQVLGGELLWTRDIDTVYDVAIETLKAWAWFEPQYKMVIA